MRHLTRIAVFAAALTIATSMAQAQQPPAAPDTADDSMPAIASTCLSCHGTGGRPALADVPIIAGQQPLYLRNSLVAYSTGRRTGGQALVMQEIVRSLNADDFETLANWFGGQ